MQRGDPAFLSLLARGTKGASNGSDFRTIRDELLTCHVAKRLTDEWRDCQRRVTMLERQYADAMRAYLRGEGPPPADAARDELVRARKEAQRLLTAALRAIDQQMQEQDRKLGGM